MHYCSIILTLLMTSVVIQLVYMTLVLESYQDFGRSKIYYSGHCKRIMFFVIGQFIQHRCCSLVSITIVASLLSLSFYDIIVAVLLDNYTMKSSCRNCTHRSFFEILQYFCFVCQMSDSKCSVPARDRHLRV